MRKRNRNLLTKVQAFQHVFINDVVVMSVYFKLVLYLNSQ